MSLRVPQGPRRIVCLTEEPTEILYALGESDRIVGITAYTERPPHAKSEKPVVSAFVGGSVEKIRALKPDLVIGFSDVQADYASTLIRAHLPVLIFNQRTIQEILDVIVTVGRLVGRPDEARALVRTYVGRLDDVRASRRALARPRVYFEEWDDPLICGSTWVSELIEVAGGTDVFATQARCPASKDRYVSEQDVIAARPDIMLASWCGKPVDHDAVFSRSGWSGVPAIERRHVYEIGSDIILQPGPAALTDGLDRIVSVFDAVARESQRPVP